jgi:hypothetical protein
MFVDLEISVACKRYIYKYCFISLIPMFKILLNCNMCIEIGIVGMIVLTLEIMCVM